MQGYAGLAVRRAKARPVEVWWTWGKKKRDAQDCCQRFMPSPETCPGKGRGLGLEESTNGLTPLGSLGSGNFWDQVVESKAPKTNPKNGTGQMKNPNHASRKSLREESVSQRKVGRETYSLPLPFPPLTKGGGKFQTQLHGGVGLVVVTPCSGMLRTKKWSILFRMISH